MANVPKIINNVVGGEISPYMSFRSDLPLYQRSVARMENFIALPHGGSRYRNGTIIANYTRGNRTGILVPFQFNDIQGYIIEVTDGKARFYKDNGVITETDKNITAVSAANPGVFTSAGHGYSNGDTVFIQGMLGPVILNRLFYQVANVTTDTFTLQDVFGIDISTVELPAYVSGGTVARVYEVTAPWAEANLKTLQWAQNADTMYVFTQANRPCKITRAGHASWTFNATVSFTGADFTSAPGKFPGCGCFIDSGRLVVAGSLDNPETARGSKSPISGATAFEDFTLGTKPTDGISFTLAPVNGKVDAIQWLANTAKFIVAGTYGSVRALYGNSISEAISPISVTAKVINASGAARVMPFSTGQNLFYVQRGGKRLNRIEYDLLQDWYKTTNINIVSSFISRPGFCNIVNQQGETVDVMWSLRNDGMLAGLTYNIAEDISGWHRHKLGGKHIAEDGTQRDYAKILSQAVLTRSDNVDQIWFLVERVINGNTVRSVEYMADEVYYPVESDYFTDEANREQDKAWYENVLYELQKEGIYLDMCQGFDATSNVAISTIEVVEGIVEEGGNPNGAFVGYGTFNVSNAGFAFRMRAEGVADNDFFAELDAEGGGEFPTQGLAGVAVDAVRSTIYAVGSDTSDNAMMYSASSGGSGTDESAFNPASQVALGSYNYPSSQFGSQKNVVCITKDRKYLFTSVFNATNNRDVIIKIEIETGNIVANSIDLAGTVFGAEAYVTELRLSPDDSTLYAVTIHSLHVMAFDTTTLTRTKDLSLYASGASTQGCSLSDDGSKLAVSQVSAPINKIWIVDTTDYSTSSFNMDTTGSDNCAVAFPKNDASHVYVASDGTPGVIVKFDLAGSVIDTYALNLSVGSINIKTLAVDPISGFIFGSSEGHISGDICMFVFNPFTETLLMESALDANIYPGALKAIGFARR